eukprot:12386787-Alexandrium_andersonii.AAC.1
MRCDGPSHKRGVPQRGWQAALRSPPELAKNQPKTTTTGRRPMECARVGGELVHEGGRDELEEQVRPQNEGHEEHEEH